MALSVDGLDLLVTPDVDDHNFGCFPMAPWAGRIRHGRFDFDGQRYQLPLNNPPHSIHGTARDHPWREDGEGVFSSPLEPPWPFGGRVVQRFSLAPDALHLTMEVHAADTPMPASCGWHPWWRRRAQRGDQLAVDLHAQAMYRRDGEGIPNGELVPPGPHPWDDCFTRLGDPPAVLQWPGPRRSRSRRPAPAWSCSTSRSTPSASSRNPTRRTRSISAPPWPARERRSS